MKRLHNSNGKQKQFFKHLFSKTKIKISFTLKTNLFIDNFALKKEKKIETRSYIQT